MAHHISFSEIDACGLPSRRNDGIWSDLPGFVGALWPKGGKRRRAFVDLRDLPEHIKRDIGVLDGNGPNGGVRW